MKIKGSIIVYGSSKNLRQQRINELLHTLDINKNNNPDILEIAKAPNKKNIGIKEVKEGIKFLNQKPFNHNYKIMIIDPAESLSLDAQNSLLKILEEPPTYASIILNSETKNALLPTILSRCKKLEITEHETTETEYSLLELVKLPMGERLTWAIDMGKRDRDEIVEILNSMLIEGEKNFRSKPSKKYAKTLETLDSVIIDLRDTNVNQKLALENLVLQI